MAEISLTAQNFEQEVLQSSIPVLVDFWAYWCGPCMIQAPILSEIAMQYPNLVKVCKVNIDEQHTLVDDLCILNVPTMLLFRDGELVKRVVGVQSKEEILALITE